MIWLAVVALGNMGVTIWFVRENRRLTQMAISRHTGDFTAMVRAERPAVAVKKRDYDDEYTTWRTPSEGVSP
jgi:hypothetical protein